VAYLQQKCEQYWPDDTSTELRYGDITVSMVSAEEWAEYVVRVLNVEKVTTNFLRHNRAVLRHLKLLIAANFVTLFCYQKVFQINSNKKVLSQFTSFSTHQQIMT